MSLHTWPPQVYLFRCCCSCLGFWRILLSWTALQGVENRRQNSGKRFLLQSWAKYRYWEKRLRAIEEQTSKTEQRDACFTGTKVEELLSVRRLISEEDVGEFFFNESPTIARQFPGWALGFEFFTSIWLLGCMRCYELLPLFFLPGSGIKYLNSVHGALCTKSGTVNGELFWGGGVSGIQTLELGR